MVPALTIKNVRVFSDAGLSEPSTIFTTSDGYLGSSADPNATVVDGEGGILLPGLIDAHVHLETESHLQELARHGVTTALDMACWPPEKIDSLRNHHLCDIRSAGLPADSPGSFHTVMLPLPDEELLSDPEQAESWVDKRISEGSDYIKLIADVPGPTQETLNALTDAAHQHDKLVVAHAATLVPFQMAVKANADVVTHVPCDQPLDAATTARMAEADKVAVPTLAMMHALANMQPGIGFIAHQLLHPITFYRIVQFMRSQPKRERNYAYSKESVAAMYKAGVPILAGTDCHETPSSPVSVLHGHSLHHELELLVEAGLSNLDALRAATSLPAKHFALYDRGVIETGKRADLVLLRDDPLEEIGATRSIKRVWCKGLEVDLESSGNGDGGCGGGYSWRNSLPIVHR